VGGRVDRRRGAPAPDTLAADDAAGLAADAAGATAASASATAAAPCAAATAAPARAPAAAASSTPTVCAATRQARVKGTAAQRAAAPRHVVAVKQPKPAKRMERAASAYKAPKAALPSGILSTGSLLPTAQKLPFLAIALVGLAILLLALGALPVGLVPNPAFAEALVERRVIFAFGGLATLAAAIAAYLLV
jgi:pilus assembly protein FimV